MVGGQFLLLKKIELAPLLPYYGQEMWMGKQNGLVLTDNMKIINYTYLEKGLFGSFLAAAKKRAAIKSQCWKKSLLCLPVELRGEGRGKMG